MTWPLVVVVVWCMLLAGGGVWAAVQGWRQERSKIAVALGCMFLAVDVGFFVLVRAVVDAQR